MNKNITKILAALLAFATITGCVGPDRQPVIIGTATPDIEVKRGIPIRASPDTAIFLGSGTAGLAVGDGAVWVLQGGKLLKINPVSNQILATFPDIHGASLAVGGGAVWVPIRFWLNFHLQRIDPNTGQVNAIISTSSWSVTVGAGSVWVTDLRKRKASRIAPQKNQIVSTFDLGPGPFGMHRAAVAAGEGAVWVLYEGTLSRIDPNTDTIVATVRLGGSSLGHNLAVGEGGVWVGKGEHLLLIDPASNQVVRPILIGNAYADAAWGYAAWWVTVGGGAVWVASRFYVAKVDPQSGRVIERIRIPGNVNYDLEMVASEGALWVIRQGGDTLWRIDFQPTK